MNCSRLLWLDPTSHGAFFTLAAAMKRAFEKEYINEQDFFRTDAVLMKQLKQTKDPANNHLTKPPHFQTSPSSIRPKHRQSSMNRDQPQVYRSLG